MKHIGLALQGILSQLVSIQLQRINVYNEANYHMTDNIGLKAIFMERVQQSRNFIVDLQQLIAQNQSTNSYQDRILGKNENIAHTKASPTGFNENASWLDKCESIENQTLKAYDASLSRDDISPETRQKISVQLGHIKKAYEFIRNFKGFNLDLTA